MNVTMQRHDYEMVSFGVRGAHDDAVSDLEGPQRTAVLAALRGLAVQLAIDFHDMNPRFKIEKFLIDALGDHDAGRALAEYDARKAEQDDDNRKNT